MGDGIVGRRRELAALRAWLKAARAGAGRLVLCVGEPGIGKTRLAQELAGIALAGGTAVAWGRSIEAEGAPAYWP
jgi:transcriptional regulator with AAA-type ATPase domain